MCIAYVRFFNVAEKCRFATFSYPRNRTPKKSQKSPSTHFSQKTPRQQVELPLRRISFHLRPKKQKLTSSTHFSGKKRNFL